MTTTVGIKTKEGIVLATDRRCTMGYYLADDDVVKVEEITPDAALTIAGSVSAAQGLSDSLRLHSEHTITSRGWGLTPTELSKLTSYLIKQSGGGLPGQFILAAREADGTPRLFSVGGDGSLLEEQDFTVSGSGTGPAVGALESQTGGEAVATMEEAVNIARKAIQASSQRDIASGNGMVVYTLPVKGEAQLKTYKFQQTVIEEGGKN